MSDERLQILKMLEEGKISSGEAARLLEALKKGQRPTSDNSATRASLQTPRKAKWMRIDIEESNGNRVHIKLPIPIIRAALRLGGHFNMGGFDSEELGPDILETLETALAEGEMGMLVDVTEENGNHVQILLE